MWKVHVVTATGVRRFTVGRRTGDRRRRIRSACELRRKRWTGDGLEKKRMQQQSSSRNYDDTSRRAAGVCPIPQKAFGCLPFVLISELENDIGLKPHECGLWRTRRHTQYVKTTCHTHDPVHTTFHRRGKNANQMSFTVQKHRKVCAEFEYEVRSGLRFQSSS